MDTIIDVCKITSNKRITLSSDIAKMLDVNDGSRVMFVEKNGELVIRKAET